MTSSAANGGDGAAASNQLVPAFDQLQVQVEPGAGIVARFPGIIAVSAPVPPEGIALLNRFLMICSEVSSAGARSPGRRLARQLAGWLSQLDDAPTLGTISPTDGGLAIFLSGAATVHLSGDSSRLSGADSAGWLDRIIDWPAALALTVDAEQGVTFTPSVFDLRQGVVPGSAALLSPSGDQAAASQVVPEPMAEPVMAEPVIAEPDPVAEPQPLAEPTPEPVMIADSVVVSEPEPVEVPEPKMTEPPIAEPVIHEPAPAEPPMTEEVVFEPPAAEPPAAAMAESLAPLPLAPPIRSARIDGAQQQEPPRPPLPLPSVAGEPIIEPESDATPKVQGFLCARGHLNDPRGLFCGICGIRMAERTGILTIGRRPPLGLLVFDDGVTFTVDSGYLLGREPDADQRVRDGAIRPLVVVDNSGAVSRRHCEIGLDGWAVLITDIGSANGTFIAPRGTQTWSALVPQRPVALEAGTRIRLGNRMLVFESPHGAP